MRFHIELYSPSKHLALISSLKLSDIDLLEIYGMTGAPANRTGEILEMSLLASEEAYVVYNKFDVLCGCFGVTRISAEEGSPWLLSNGDLSDLPFILCKQSREIVAGWMLKYTLLWNFVSVENTRSQQWLEKILKFTVHRNLVHSFRGVGFYKFSKRRKEP